MNKKLIAVLSSIIVLLLLASGLYYFFGSSNGSIKEEHTKYLALINESHDFKGGLAGLETLDNDKGQEAFKNIKTEIKIAKELKNSDSSLDNKDVDAAKKSLEKVDSLTTDNSFDKAIEWLKEDITNYEKALKEIKEAKSDDINSILDKYKFKHSALKSELSENSIKQENTKQPNAVKEKGTVTQSPSTQVSSGISDNDVIPAGASYVFSGTVTNSTTYKEFRQTNAYQTIATNYIGFNASNAEIKACLEWLIQKGKEGAQAMPSTEEYNRAFGR